LEKSVHELADTQLQVYEIMVKRVKYLTRRIAKLELVVGLVNGDFEGDVKLFANLIQEGSGADSPDS
jgi:hypothetical protein